MSTTTSTCFHMHCDAKIADDCDDVVIDEEYEQAIHFRTPSEAETFAFESRYWAKIGDVWHCVPCKGIVAQRPHAFQSDCEGSSLCGICEEWATEGLHGLEVSPGQLELTPVPVASGADPATTTEEEAS